MKNILAFVFTLLSLSAFSQVATIEDRPVDCPTGTAAELTQTMQAAFVLDGEKVLARFFGEKKQERAEKFASLYIRPTLSGSDCLPDNGNNGNR